mmetsp:Transcript_46672/g.99038  ORF Transcript_46672/g.99038 Transcript_46672/m.99038 type:complete len:217 (-) Transcript_46672:37-687(-)
MVCRGHLPTLFLDAGLRLLAPGPRAHEGTRPPSGHHLQTEGVEVGRLQRRPVHQQLFYPVLADLPRPVPLIPIPVPRRGQIYGVYRYPVHVHGLPSDFGNQHGVEAHPDLGFGRVVHHPGLNHGTVGVVEEGEHRPQHAEGLFVRRQLGQLDLTVGCREGDGVVVDRVVGRPLQKVRIILPQNVHGLADVHLKLPLLVDHALQKWGQIVFIGLRLI